MVLRGLSVFLACLVFLSACERKEKAADQEVTPASKDVDTSQQVVLPPPPAEEPQEPPTFLEMLSRAALERTTHSIVYDGSYVKIDYPMGDISSDKGVCTDVVIRSYREMGIDLQQVVHEDMKSHFGDYPSRELWGHRTTDTNIDHRRVPNLRVFFKRKGEVLKITDNPLDYQPGDIVTWSLGIRKPHIGIVAEQFSMDVPNRHLMIHNIGAGTVLEDMLFDLEITGHYRYQ